MPARAAAASPWLWIWPTLFVLQFFLPYIPGTRYRVEVFTLLLSLGVFLTRVKFTAAEGDLALLTVLSGLWSALRLGYQRSPDGVMPTIIQWINLNFIFLATCLYLLFRVKLQQHRFRLVKAALVISSINNLVALAQCYWPDMPFHSKIYENFGGTINSDYDALLTQFTTVAMSNAEFLAKMGSRYSGLMVSSHMLSVLNVWVCGAAIGLFRDSRSSRADVLLAIASAVLGVVGGMLSGGKMFYLGLSLLFMVYVVVARKFSALLVVGMCAAGFMCAAPLFLKEGSDVKRQIDSLMRGEFKDMLASRFDGSRGYLVSTIERLQTDRGLFYFGTGADLGDLVVADSLFMLPLCSGGIILLVLYMLPLFWLPALLLRRCNSSDEQLTMQFCIHASFVLAGIGVPVYQMGRLAPLFWIVAMAFAFAPPDRVATVPAPHVRLPIRRR